jgi:hypothetical protein
VIDRIHRRYSWCVRLPVALPRPSCRPAGPTIPLKLTFLAGPSKGGSGWSSQSRSWLRCYPKAKQCVFSFVQTSFCSLTIRSPAAPMMAARYPLVEFFTRAQKPLRARAGSGSWTRNNGKGGWAPFEAALLILKTPPLHGSGAGKVQMCRSIGRHKTDKKPANSIWVGSFRVRI